MPKEANSATIEEYLEAIFRLEKQGGFARASQVAEALGVSQPSVAEMIKRLISQGLLQRDKSKGITLTREGQKEALALVRRHRLSERFFVDVLGLSWEKAHEEACLFEHILSPEVEERLAEFLNNPKTCPHGHPIPTKEGKLHEPETHQLSGLHEGDKGRISAIDEDEPLILAYLQSRGINPDAKVDILKIEPFGGPIHITVNGEQLSLGPKAASKIRVKMATG